MDCFGLEKGVDAKSTTSQVLGSTFISPKLKTEVCSKLMRLIRKYTHTIKIELIVINRPRLEGDYP